jgi:hypothetical protein
VENIDPAKQAYAQYAAAMMDAYQQGGAEQMQMIAQQYQQLQSMPPQQMLAPQIMVPQPPMQMVPQQGAYSPQQGGYAPMPQQQQQHQGYPPRGYQLGPPDGAGPPQW